MTDKKEQSKETNAVNDLKNTEKLEAAKKENDDNTPLVVVREKEIELRKYLIEKQSKADKIIADSKKEAVIIKEKMSVEGEIKAQDFYNNELIKIEKEAKEISSQSPAKAKAVTEIGRKNLDKAIAQLKDILAPKRS